MMKYVGLRILLGLVVLLIVYALIKIQEMNSVEDEYTAPPRSHWKSYGFGERAEPVKIERRNLTLEEQVELDTSSKNISLNAFVSDRISLRRFIPDERHKSCKTRIFGDLPDTSVIITFHNELYSLLLRTLHSVVDRSPPELIKEIILVDDGSDYDYINGKLQKYLETNFAKVKLIHTKSQLGLIKARLAGIEIATGETLTFLDSHVECLTGWLEPLLEQIKINKTRVAEPELPNISNQDFSIAYTDFPRIGSFNWKQEFVWLIAYEEVFANGGDKSLPMRDTILVGGVFTIHREFFKSIGYWDAGLELYGYENFELSFKAWMCHGSIYKVPCSVVAHVFHNRKIGNWKLNGRLMKRNADRVAEVWMDEYKEFYYQRSGPKSQDLGDISHLLELRKENKCHNFEWFMKNVVPQYVDPKQSLRRNMIRNPATGLCLINEYSFRDLVGFPCTKPTIDASNIIIYSTSYWDMSKEGYLCTENQCIVYESNQIKTYPRIWLDLIEPFEYDELNKMFIFKSRKECLEIKGTNIMLNACNKTAEHQKWVWGPD